MTTIKRALLLLALCPVLAGYAHGDEIERGQYLTNLMGCEGCHTEGLILGEPNGLPFAGSSIGIAYSQYVDAVNPPIVFASNLTPDKATGLGDWTKNDIVLAIRHGADIHSQNLAPVMPWLNYSQLSKDDALAIASYLKSLPPVKHVVPDAVDQGEVSKHRFIRLGIYVFIPDDFSDADRASPTDEPLDKQP